MGFGAREGVREGVLSLLRGFACWGVFLQWSTCNFLTKGG